MKKVDEDVPNWQLNKQNNIVKEVDKQLIAERIAVEIKAHFEVYSSGNLSFNSYLNTAREEIEYSQKEELEILEMAEKILNDKYKI